MEQFKFDDIPMNEPGNGSTFPVIRGIDKNTNMRVVAKIFDNYSEQSLYVDDEIRLNKQIHIYDWTPFAEYLSAFPLENDRYMIIFREIIGFDLSYEIICMSSFQSREKWFFQVMFALCCCHMSSIFHQDLADIVSKSTLNVRVGSFGKRLRMYVIDFGDGVRPTARDDYAISLERDINGIENLLTHLLCGNIGISTVFVSDLKAIDFKSLTINDARFAIYNALVEFDFQFPPGFAGFYQTQM